MVVCFGLAQLVGVWGILSVVGLFSLTSTNAIFDPLTVLAVVLGYLLASVFTTLGNAVISGYVLAVELGTPGPLTYTLQHVRRRLPELLKYAVFSAVVLSSIRLCTVALRQKTAAGELLARFVSGTLLITWYAATIYAIPILLFEGGGSMKRVFSRSTSLLRETKWRYATTMSAWPVLLASVIIGVELLFSIGGVVGLSCLFVAVVSGAVVYRTYNAMFRMYLYGEVAGPFSLSNTQ
ncbi:hypothetical protein A4G99_11000 [Haladaptatus sp. R4]|nr:hypothetical protein A4G99_11000 [Haladaptatus sp. R4]